MHLKSLMWKILCYVNCISIKILKSFPGGSDSKESACNVGDLASIPGLGRSSEEGNGYPSTPVFLNGEFHGLRSLAGL